MGKEFLTETFPQKSFTEVFREELPFYLAIGMSLTEYYDGDANLVKYFRQAYRIKQEQDDYNAWLQGLYIYKAVDCAIYNNPPLIKRGSEARKYYENPIMQDNNKSSVESEEAEALRKEQEEAAMAVWLENFVNMYKYVNN